MERRTFGLLVLTMLLAACDLAASDWPDRQGKTADQMLLDLVQHHQRQNVRTSVGELAHECFTDLDFNAFTRRRTPDRIVERLQQAPDFAQVVDALKTLPPERLDAVLRQARQRARPTWRVMGFIDRQGRGQTEAGHRAELMIAGAIVDAFASRLVSPEPPR